MKAPPSDCVCSCQRTSLNVPFPSYVPSNREVVQNRARIFMVSVPNFKDRSQAKELSQFHSLPNLTWESGVNRARDVHASARLGVEKKTKETTRAKHNSCDRAIAGRRHNYCTVTHYNSH